MGTAAFSDFHRPRRRPLLLLRVCPRLFYFPMPRLRVMQLAACILLALLIAGKIQSANAAVAQRPALLFDLDQGLPFGITENLDLIGLHRIFNVMEKFRSHFDIYAIFSPLTAKSENLKKILREAARYHVPFLLDVYTSDSMTIGDILTPVNPQADLPHALTISLDGLRHLKADKDIGPYFAGIRFFEVLAQDFTVKTCMQKSRSQKRVKWCDHFSRNIMTKDVFTPAIARPLLDFAKQHQMWVFWSDWKWDAQTVEQQNILRQILAAGTYHDVIVLAYSNNLPNEIARDNDLNWREWKAEYSPLVGAQIRGLGFSDQSWTCYIQRDCAVDVIKDWAMRALRSGAVALEFEPANYFFELPTSDNTSEYPNSTKWKQISGRPRAALVLVAEALGIDLRAQEPSPFSGTEPDRATCISINTAKHQLKAGERFDLSLIFQNSGVNNWSSQGDLLTSLGVAKWGVEHRRLPVAVVAPGQNVTFSFNLTAPASAGLKPVVFSMKRRNGKLFGQACSVLELIKSK